MGTGMRCPGWATLALLLVATTARAQSGGSFDLSWSSVTGGGSNSAGGTFVLAGTMATASSDRSVGGTYQLDSGWGGVIATVGAPRPPDALPRRFELLPARPNPFTRGTTIGFEVPHAAAARATVYDVSGQRVRLLVNATLAPGRHSIVWDGTDDAGRLLPGGIYFLRVEAGEFSAATRVALLR